jgi:hypothetical protein
MAKYVADLTDVEHIFASQDEENQWVEWDFKTAEIEPTHYSIQTHGGESGEGHLQNWVLEGRNAQEECLNKPPKNSNAVNAST